MAIKISELNATTSPHSNSEIAIAYGGSNYRVKITDLLSTSDNSALYPTTLVVLGDSGSNAVEGGQIYMGFPTASKNDIAAAAEGNAWNIDMYHDTIGQYGGDNAFLRVFSPLARAGADRNNYSTATGGHNGHVNRFTPRGGFTCTSILCQSYNSYSLGRASASKADRILWRAYGMSSQSDITVGQSFIGGTIQDANPIIQRDLNPGMRMDYINTITGGTNFQGNSQDDRMDIFLDAFGNYQLTYPKVSGDSTRMTLAPNGNLTIEGTLSESDKRIKHNIRDISEAETKVAQKLKSSFKVFNKNKSSKLSIGVIAQEVISFFEEEGLNAFDYSIIESEKKYVKISDEGKIIEKHLPLDREYTNAEVTLKSGEVLIGKKSQHFDLDATCEQDCMCSISLEKEDGSSQVIHGDDIQQIKYVPIEGYEETEVYAVNYSQVYAFIISTL
jgi:hypothetical protein